MVGGVSFVTKEGVHESGEEMGKYIYFFSLVII